MPTDKEKQKFALEIEQYVEKEQAVNYIDAIMLYCEKRKMEPELAATLINKELKAKITLDAELLNLVPKSGRLPI